MDRRVAACHQQPCIQEKKKGNPPGPRRRFLLLVMILLGRHNSLRPPIRHHLGPNRTPCLALICLPRHTRSGCYGFLLHAQVDLVGRAAAQLMGPRGALALCHPERVARRACTGSYGSCGVFDVVGSVVHIGAPASCRAGDPGAYIAAGL